MTSFTKGFLKTTAKDFNMTLKEVEECQDRAIHLSNKESGPNVYDCFYELLEKFIEKRNKSY